MGLKLKLIASLARDLILPLSGEMSWVIHGTVILDLK